MKYEQWIDTCIEVYFRPKLKESTVLRYLQTINFMRANLPDLLNMELKDISNMILQKALNSHFPKKYSKSTLRKLRSMFNLTLKLAFSNGIIKAFPCPGLFIPEAPEKEISALTPTEQMLVEDYALSDPLGHIVFFFLNTGLREGELINLMWKDIDLKDGLMYIRKSKTKKGERIVPLIPDMIVLLRSIPHESRDNFVFHTTIGSPISHSSLHHLYLRIRRATGISSLSNHVYRHTFATRAIESGMCVSALSEILGHTDPGFTARRYVHPNYNYLKKQMMVYAHATKIFSE